MSEAGDRRSTRSDAAAPHGPTADRGAATPGGRPPGGDAPRSRGGAAGSPRRGIAVALGIVLGAAVAWALLRGILELGVGLLAVAALGGWAIGAALRSTGSRTLLAMALAAAAWLLGLLLTWLLALAILPGSSRTLLERIEATPFTEWMAPQFGILEVGGLVVFLVAAAYGARRSA